mgnify:CR=1 FL=1
MNYIVFDLEFNQGYTSAAKCPFEIIQIGAVKLDENFNTLSTFDKLIKPEVYTAMHPFVGEITGLTMEQLNAGACFKDIYKEFVEFTNAKASVLCVWGMTDMKELFRNVKYHELDFSLLPKEYINLQRCASKYLNCPKGTNIGLGTAVELLNIEALNKFHHALNDAYYTAEVFKSIYNKKIKTSIYNPDRKSKINPQNNGSEKVDTYNLIKQFTKMYNREMTEEEQSIIKLAYLMGKTHQFILKTDAN